MDNNELEAKKLEILLSTFVSKNHAKIGADVDCAR